jgi:hypothetical protein
MSTEAIAPTDLEILVGEHKARTVVVEGKSYVIPIKQIKTGKIPKLLRAMGPLMITISDRSKPIEVDQIFMMHTEECLDMLSVLINKPREFVDELDPQDTLFLIGDCIEVNLDFFIQKILPVLSGGISNLIQELQKKKSLFQKLAGQKQPKSSSEPDTLNLQSGNMNTESSTST